MKKRCLTLCLTILAVIFCTFGFTACKDENEKYYGVYKDQSTTFEIKKDCVEINGEKRTYTIDGNTLSIEGYTADTQWRSTSWLLRA